MPFSGPATVDTNAIAASLLSDALPAPEGVVGTAGMMPKASKGDHAHERLTSTHPNLTLDATGKRTVVYSRTFDKAPGVFPVPQTPPAGTMTPTLSYAHVTTVINGVTMWTGCVISGERPGTAVTVLGLQVLQANVAAANAPFNLTAIASSQPA